VGGELATYLAQRFNDITHHTDFENTLPGLVAFDELYEDRVRRIRECIASICKLN